MEEKDTWLGHLLDGWHSIQMNPIINIPKSALTYKYHVSIYKSKRIPKKHLRRSKIQNLRSFFKNLLFHMKYSNYRRLRVGENIHLDMVCIKSNRQTCMHYELCLNSRTITIREFLITKTKQKRERKKHIHPTKHACTHVPRFMIPIFSVSSDTIMRMVWKSCRQ